MPPQSRLVHFRLGFLLKALRVVKFALPLLLLATLTISVDASRIPFSDSVYTLIAEEEPLPVVLRNFCAAQGITAVISQKVTGAVSGSFEAMNPKDFLREFTRAYGLVWYYDGSVLYIYDSSEMTTELVNLERLSTDKLRETLVSLGIWDNSIPWRASAEQGIVFVTGPPRFVEIVQQTATALDAKSVRQAHVTEAIRVFPLQYAWAEDLTVEFMKNDLTVPGVATVLRNILAGQPLPAAVDGVTDKRLGNTVRKLKGEGLIDKEKPENPETPPSQASNLMGPTPTGAIMADQRMNAVIVRDAEYKMPFYEDVIKALDRPMGLVEIQAVIVDVNSRNVRELGVDWRFSNQSTNGKEFTQTMGGLNTTSDFTPDNSDLILGSGGNFSTLYQYGSSYFLAKCKLLEEDGKAHVLSRPSVLTLDNVQAQLEHTSTFYVRVEGNEEVDLFDVTSGTVLKVTPHIVDTPTGKMIKLVVSIQDGTSSEDSEVDEIPVTSTSTINTQAVIPADKSLLIGGYYYEANTKDDSGLPLLGRIPVLGYLFKTENTDSQYMERLFLITPRIVDPNDGTPRGVSAGVPEDVFNGPEMSFSEENRRAAELAKPQGLKHRWGCSSATTGSQDPAAVSGYGS